MFRTFVTAHPQSAVFIFDEHLRYLRAGGQALGESTTSNVGFIGKAIYEALPKATVAQIEVHYLAALLGEVRTFNYERETHGVVYVARSFPLLGLDNEPIAGAVIVTPTPKPTIGYDISRNVSANRTTRQQQELANALRDITGVLNSTLELPQVLKRILDNIGIVVPHDSANIMLISDGIAQVVRIRGYPPAMRPVVQSLELDIATTPHLAQMMTSGQPVVLHGASIDYANGSKYFPGGPRVQSYLGTPIRLAGEVIGFLNLESRVAMAFGDTPSEWLSAFTDSAAIAIRNAQLFERAQGAIVWEERQAIARDLHDAVSQTLFAANMIADALPYLWDKNAGQVPGKLHDLRQLTHHAMAELRTMLLELRPQTLETTDFEDLLKQLLRTYGSRTKTEFGLVFATSENVDLPVEVKVTFYRIAQEAINNIINHSAASNATIWVQQPGDTLMLIVADNGRGFEIDLSYPGHHGLRIMRERAEKIGATVEIRSAINKGTTIEVMWPLANDSR